MLYSVDVVVTSFTTFLLYRSWMMTCSLGLIATLPSSGTVSPRDNRLPGSAPSDRRKTTLIELISTKPEARQLNPFVKRVAYRSSKKLALASSSSASSLGLNSGLPLRPSFFASLRSSRF